MQGFNKRWSGFSAHFFCFFLLGVGTLASPTFGQTVLHVDGSGPPGGDGSSWGAAFRTVQAALAAAAGLGGQPVVIKVAQGRYVPTQRSDPNDPRSATFQLLNNCALSGGYAGLAGADPNARDIELYETILSGDLNGDDQPNFVNYNENAYHVLVGSGTNSTAVLDGFTVSGGNANVGNQAALPTSAGGGLFCRPGSPVVSNCRFRLNVGYKGSFYLRDGNMVVEDCVFEGNLSLESVSALMYFGNGNVVIRRCSFAANTTVTLGTTVSLHYPANVTVTDCIFHENVGTGLKAFSNSGLTVQRCEFSRNYSAVGGGSAIESQQSLLEDCVYVDNSSDFAAGATSLIGIATVKNCRFIRNRCNLFGGAVFTDGGQSTMVNCTFIGNDGHSGGAILNVQPVTLTNCSFSQNKVNTVNSLQQVGAPLATVEARNCIFWASAPGIFGADPLTQIPPPPPTLYFCDVEGGWTGAGANNINVDPMFVQAGCDNLRLAYGSPCIDVGNNSYISGVPTDLDGQPRIQNGIVDLGAYEDGHEMLPPAACVENLGQGEEYRLVPTGGTFNPIQRAAVYFVNMNGPEGANAMATQFHVPMHPMASGYNELGDAINVHTSLFDGELYMRVIIPFDQSNLNGFNWQDVQLTYYHPLQQRWMVAAAANVQNSPEHSGPLGDHIVVQGTGNAWGWTGDLGDYGVFWNPDLQKGFAWANVDHASDFAIGVPRPLCPGDCLYPGDGMVNKQDMFTVLGAWGAAVPGPLSFADVDRNGVVNVTDLLLVINSWGPCR